MSEELPAEVVGRLEEAISNVDQISLRVAQVIGIFDELFFSGNFEIDEFENEVAQAMELDETETRILKRAICELHITDSEARYNGIDPNFLGKTTMDLSKYSGRPTVTYDPTMPGVVVVHLKSKEDAAQFELDTEPEEIKGLRKAIESVGRSVQVGSRPSGSFIGRLVDMESLGLPATLSFKVIALVEENVTEADGVLDHEYLHFIESIVRRHFHRYFGSTELPEPATNVESLERIPEAVRAKLVASIGPLRKNDPILSTKPGVDTETDTQEIFATLQHERKLLDEMRAYGLGNGFIVPAQMQTTKLSFNQEYFSRFGRFDILMAKRYFDVQLRMLSLWIRGGNAYKQGLAVLGAALSLSQAARILDVIIDLTPLNMDDEQTRRMTEVIRNTSGAFNFLDYTIGGAELISPEEVARYVPELPTD